MNENNKKNKLSFNKVFGDIREKISKICLLYTSDAADDNRLV